MALWCYCFQETYPQVPPIWFSEAEDAVVPVVIEKLGETSEKNFNVRILDYLCIITSRLNKILPLEFTGLVIFQSHYSCSLLVQVISNSILPQKSSKNLKNLQWQYTWLG
jgi:hypothetical protein